MSCLGIPQCRTLKPHLVFLSAMFPPLTATLLCTQSPLCCFCLLWANYPARVMLRAQHPTMVGGSVSDWLKTRFRLSGFKPWTIHSPTCNLEQGFSKPHSTHLKNRYNINRIADSDGEESACNVGDPSLIPGLRRCPGGGNGNPFQYSCLENSMDGGAWRATVLVVEKSWTRLSDYIFTFKI